MADVDVFNGDADGICSLIQLRLAEPKNTQLVTGIKRDINLLEKVAASSGDKITVLDVSFDKNRKGVDKALENGAEIFYVDHHFAGEVPENDRLNTIINTSPDVCTSILINAHLKGQFVLWAIVGAFGDNLKNSARNLCKPLNLSETEIESLENLGIFINYNGYGASLTDLHFTPSELYQCLVEFDSPFSFIENNVADFDKLSSGYYQDMQLAEELQAEFSNDKTAIFILPNETWARRVSGVFSNSLTNQFPDRAHAVLTLKDNGNYLVSVRAPLNNKTGADEFCRSFATGGGRAAAAGVNDLPSTEETTFIEKFNNFYS